MKQAKRKWHYIKANAQSETPNCCIFVDCETDSLKLDKSETGYVLRFGWACYVRRTQRGQWTKPKWKRFSDYEDFWLWVMAFVRSRKRLWIWSHQTKFDLLVLHTYTHLPELGWKYLGGIMDAPPTIQRYRNGTSTITLCDTLNIWRMPLKKLGKKVGLHKLEMPKEWHDDSTDDAYCQRDAAIIHKAFTEWTDFLRDNDMGSFAPTIAGQAMKTFRHKYMKHRILIDCNEEALKCARNCYHGARVECGFIGHVPHPLHYLDVNSMYPYVMSYAEMPTKLVHFTKLISVRGLRRLSQSHCVCAWVTLDTDEPFAAVVHDGKLCFPVGRFQAWLTTPEIEYALDHGYVVEVHACGAYEKGVIFREFALDLYKHKEECVRNGRLVESEQWKLLLNSFYGKWGQNGRKWVDVGTCDPNLFVIRPDKDAQTGEEALFRYFGGILSTRSKEAESRESHPAIAAHVCAHARMVLWALIRQLSPKNYFYCDTDGLLTSSAGIDILADRIDQYRLGALKHVKTIQDVWINGCKDLVLDGKRTLKGIRDDAKQIDERTFHQIKWLGLPSLLRCGSIDMPRTVMITKTLRRTYDKGLIGFDGFVHPLISPLTDGTMIGSIPSK